MPKVYCTIFEDNNVCIALAECPKIRPISNHIGLKYHHFRLTVKQVLVSIEYVNTQDRMADLLTNDLGEAQFLKLWKLRNGY